MKKSLITTKKLQKFCSIVIAVMMLSVMFVATCVPAFAGDGDETTKAPETTAAATTSNDTTSSVVSTIFSYIGYIVAVAGVFIVVAGIIMYALAQREQDATRQSGAWHWIIAGVIMIVVGTLLGTLSGVLLNAIGGLKPKQ